MKRSPLTRKTELKRGAPLRSNQPLKRTTRLRPGKRSRGVPADIRTTVALRDGGCVARTAIPSVACWGRLDPHHVLRRSQGGPDTPDNLVTLCRAHHEYVHGHPAEARALGFLRSPGGDSPTE